MMPDETTLTLKIADGIEAATILIIPKVMKCSLQESGCGRSLAITTYLKGNC